MIYQQPVFHEFENLKMPVLLIIGDHDNTAPGKQLAPPEIRAQLGNYPVLAEAAVKRFKQGKLIRFADLGHSPQIQDPARFHAALLDALSSLEAVRRRPGQEQVRPGAAGLALRPVQGKAVTALLEHIEL